MIKNTLDGSAIRIIYIETLTHNMNRFRVNVIDNEVVLVGVGTKTGLIFYGKRQIWAN